MAVLIAIGALLFSGCDSIWPGANGELSAVVKIIDAPESMWGQDINWWQTKEVDRNGDPCPDCHSVDLNDDPNNSAQTLSHDGIHGVCAPNGYKEHTMVTITATAKDNYEFVKWTTSTSGVTIISPNSASTKFYMPCKNVEITANFCTKHILAMLADPLDSGTVSGAGKYCPNKWVDIEATAKTGWEFVNWTANFGTFNYSTAASTYFSMPYRNATITAHFEKGCNCGDCNCDVDCDCPDCCDTPDTIIVNTPDVDVEVPVDCGDVNVDLPIWNSEFDKYVYIYFNIENTGADIQEYTVTFTAYGVTPGIGTPIKSTDYTTYTGSVTGVNLAAGEDRDSFAQIDVANDKVVWVELASLELQ